MDTDLAKVIAERARTDHYMSGLLTLFGCVIAEIAKDIPVDRREHIMRCWKKLHLQKINEDVDHVQRNISTLTFVEKVLFGTSGIDGETIRVLGKQMLDEMEPGIRVLLALEDTE